MATDTSRFLWYELLTTDVAAAKAFYAEVVPYKIEAWPMGDSHYDMFVAAHGPIGGLMTLPEEARAMGAPPHWLAYVGVEDVDATVARFEAAGGRTFAPPFDVPEVGRIAIVADPQGAAIGLLAPAGDPPEGTAGPVATGKMAWHELATTDYVAARKFYSDLFDWEFGDAMDMGGGVLYQLFMTDEGGQGGGIFNKPPQMPMAAWIYYINVDDLDAAVDRVKAHGGQIVNGPMEVPGGDRIAQGLDPQGAMFALHWKNPAGTGA